MSNSSYFANDIDDLALPTAPAKAGNPQVGRGVLARIFNRVVQAREAHARREANRYLARQPDRLLRDIGLDETEIAKLRRRYEA